MTSTTVSTVERIRLAPTRNASQGLGAQARSDPAVDNRPGPVMFMVCSDAYFVVAAAALSGLDASGAPAALRTCSSIRR